jgi:hypothetical protein
MDFDKAEAIQQAQLALLRKKNADYGDHNITLTGLAGVVTRMSDKMERLRKLALEGHEPNFESIEDTLDDMSLYGVIGRLVLADGIVAHPTLVYLGGPIGSLSEEERTLWRLRSRRIFQYYGVGCFDPAGALHPQPAVNRPRVSAINDAAMRACDVCLFNLERGRGFGSAREVERAVQWGKRLKTPTGFWPAARRDTIPRLPSSATWRRWTKIRTSLTRTRRAPVPSRTTNRYRPTRLKPAGSQPAGAS